MNIKQYYQEKLKQSDFKPDSGQAMVVSTLADLQAELEAKEGLIHGIKKTLGLHETTRGLYLWGGVGRGKTFLMDLFFESLTFKAKKRIHFHRFMQQVHHELARLQGKKNPLSLVAKRFAEEAYVLCFDEFFVSDIGDAMLLGKLLQHLFENRVTLIATSNVEPKLLYPNGLQRDKFLPAIELLEKHTHIMHLDGGEDYRLRALEKAELYHVPSDAQNEQKFEQTFLSIAPERGRVAGMVVICDRPLSVLREADSIVWVDFKELCMRPRAAMDYIEIARLYRTVMISSVPAMNDSMMDVVRRFITLIDTFYDHHVTLIAAADVPLGNLYSGHRLRFEFERTLSRLQEMQTHQYLSKPHLA